MEAVGEGGTKAYTAATRFFHPQHSLLMRERKAARHGNAAGEGAGEGGLNWGERRGGRQPGEKSADR